MKNKIIKDLKETIERLQKECTEKTDAIIILGEKIEALEIKNKVLKSNRLDMFEHLEIVQENKKLKKIISEIELLTYELTNEEYTNFIEYKQKQILEKIKEL